METTMVETSRHEAEGIPLYHGIRWNSVFAGLAVGLGTHLLLMLVGIAAGLAVFGAGGRPDGGSISIAAASWNTFSMVAAAFVGGYVAARGTSLRRNSDGMLHGVVSWGATMLFFAVLTGSVTGNAISGMFGMATETSSAAAARADNSTMTELFASIERGDRSTAIALLRDRLGLTEEQAGRAVDQAGTMIGGAQGGANEARMEDAAQAASVASTWLSVAILLSLGAAATGGLVGARGTRLRALPGHHAEVRVARRAHTTHQTPVVE